MSILTMHHGLMASIKQGDPPGYVTIGENLYPYVQIGDKLWLAENLKETIGSSQWYNDDPIGYGHYGQYYYWNELLNDDESPKQALLNILPSGWRIPTSDDFVSISTELAPHTDTIRAIKSTTEWTGGGGNGDNSSGLNIYPSGRLSDTTWESKGSWAYLTQSEFNRNGTSLAFAMSNYITSQVMVHDYNKVPVRLVKDA